MKIVINIRGPEIVPEIVKDLGPVTDAGRGQGTRRSLQSEGSPLCTGMFPRQGLSTLLRFSTRVCSRPVRSRQLWCRILPRFSLHNILPPILCFIPPPPSFSYFFYLSLLVLEERVRKFTLKNNGLTISLTYCKSWFLSTTTSRYSVKRFNKTNILCCFRSTDSFSGF